jgi:putative endonuclease
MNTYCVYILTTVSRNVMYVGVTNDLERRIDEHRDGKGGAFTKRYRVNTLVYAEAYEQIDEATTREKEIKAWRRSKKDALVEKANPTWADLLDETAAKGPSLRSSAEVTPREMTAFSSSALRVNARRRSRL